MSISFNLCATAFGDYVFAQAKPLVEGRVAGVRGERPAAWHQRPRRRSMSP